MKSSSFDPRGKAALGILVLALVLCFFRVVFQGETLRPVWVAGVTPYGPHQYPGSVGVGFYTYGGDPGGSGWQILAEEEKTAQEYRKGHLPLWNPNQMFGVPLAHNLQISALFPLKILFVLSTSPLMWDFYKFCLFLIAGFFTYLYLRKIDLSGASALLGAISYMLSGALVMYAHFSFMDILAMIPVLLYLAERLLLSPKREEAGWLALAVAATSLSGYPVPLVLALLFVGLYVVYRAFDLSRFRWREKLPWCRLGWVGLAYTMGALIALPLIAPGVDVLLNTNNVRPPGMGFGVNAFQYFYGAFFPYILTYLDPKHYELWCNWHGLIPTFLALIACRRKIAGPAPFFIAFTVFGYMKLAGLPPAHWIAHLPFLNRVIYTRYLQPEIALSVAILAAFGLETILEKAISLRGIVLRVGLLLLAITVTFYSHRELYSEWRIHAGALRTLLLGSVWIVLFFGAALLVYLRKLSVSTTAKLFLCLGALELASYGWHPRCKRYDPFTEAPYLKYLKAQPDRFRVLGLGNMLFPPYSSAFDIDDVRWMNAITYPHYARFVNEFICPVGACVDRFVGVEPEARLYAKGGGLTPYLDLANAKYLLTVDDINAVDVNRKLLHQTRWTEEESPLKQTMHLNKHALVQRVPSEIPIYLEVRDLSASLDFAVSLKNPGKTDFKVVAQSVDKFQLLFDHKIDPKRRVADRRWHTGSADVSKFRGKRILLRLKTDPLRGQAWDYAFWSDFRLDNALLTVDYLQNRFVAALGGVKTQVSQTLVAGEKLPTISANSPSTLDYLLELPSTATELTFRYTLGESSWDPNLGDGVGFSVEAGIFEEAVLYHQTIDDTQSWHNASLDLSSFKNRAVGLNLMASGSSPEALWGEMRLNYSTENNDRLVKVYDDDFRIYENKAVLPRAFIVRDIEFAATEDAMVDILRRPGIDLQKTAVLKDNARGVLPLTGMGNSAGEPVTITSYGAQKVVLKTFLENPGVLVLTDAFSPKWNAKVDGREVPIFQTDLTFRSVYLEKGNHEIIFEYRDRILTVSLVISGFSLLLTGYLIWRKK